MTTYRGTAQIQPVNDQNIHVVPLLESHDGITPFIPIRRVGPIDLLAGDEVTVDAYEQIDNECQGRPGDRWEVPVPVKGTQQIVRTETGKYRLEQEWQMVDLDPRRTLDVMVELAIYRSPTPGIGGTRVGFQRGENVNNLTHHWMYQQNDTDFITAAGRFYYVTAVRFGWTPLFLKGMVNARMEVLPRGKITAKVDR